MSEPSVPGLGDLLGLFGGANPLASIGKTIEQFKRGVNDFLGAVENFNETMKTMNEVATRVNRLVDDIEEPVRALMPQVTRSIKAADAVIDQLTGPVERVAPGISRLADTLSSPVFTAMPNEIAQFLETLGDLASRLQPLSQMAEAAGGMFGLQPLAALRNTFNRTATPPPPPKAPETTSSSARATSVKQAPAKKAATKQAATKKAVPATTGVTAKKAAAKQAVAAKKAPARAPRG